MQQKLCRIHCVLYELHFMTFTVSPKKCGAIAPLIIHVVCCCFVCVEIFLEVVDLAD